MHVGSISHDQAGREAAQTGEEAVADQYERKASGDWEQRPGGVVGRWGEDKVRTRPVDPQPSQIVAWNLG